MEVTIRVIVFSVPIAAADVFLHELFVAAPTEESTTKDEPQPAATAEGAATEATQPTTLTVNIQPPHGGASLKMQVRGRSGAIEPLDGHGCRMAWPNDAAVRRAGKRGRHRPRCEAVLGRRGRDVPHHLLQLALQRRGPQR